MKPDIKGLTKLAQKLARVPKSQFDMGSWWEKKSCGTAGCIAGWAAATFPHRFRKEVTYTSEDGKYQDYEVINRRTESTGSAAFADAFHISEEDAEDITLEHIRSKSTPQKAAKAIRAYIGKLKKAAKK